MIYLMKTLRFLFLYFNSRSSSKAAERVLVGNLVPCATISLNKRNVIENSSYPSSLDSSKLKSLKFDTPTTHLWCASYSRIGPCIPSFHYWQFQIQNPLFCCYEIQHCVLIPWSNFVNKIVRYCIDNNSS